MKFKEQKLRHKGCVYVNILFCSISKDRIKVQSEQAWVTATAQSWLETVSKSSQEGRKSFYSTLSPNFRNDLMAPRVPRL